MTGNEPSNTERKSSEAVSSSLFDFFACAVGGFVSSLATVYIHYLLFKYGDVSFYTYMVYGFIPIGAGCMGAVAASGYYLCATILHHMPTPRLLLAMAATATFTFVLCYYMEYVLSDHGSDDFIEFMSTYLTEQIYSFGEDRYNQGGGFEVGHLGYVLAVIQLIGFMAGGIIVYYALRHKLACPDCGKYFQVKGAYRHFFMTIAELAQYDRLMKQNPRFSNAYMDMLATNHGKFTIAQGSITSNYTLFACPGCGHQILEREVTMTKGKDEVPVTEFCYAEHIDPAHGFLDYFDRKKRKAG